MRAAIQLPKYLTQDELTRFFSRRDGFPRAIPDPRDRALFALVYHYGLRVEEACLITLHDLDLSRSDRVAKKSSREIASTQVTSEGPLRGSDRLAKRVGWRETTMASHRQAVAIVSPDPACLSAVLHLLAECWSVSFHRPCLHAEVHIDKFRNLKSFRHAGVKDR